MIDLRRMRFLINKLSRFEWEIEKKTAAATRITSHISGMPRGGGGNSQEDAMIVLADALSAYREAIDELEGMRRELEPLIDRLEDMDEKAVMRMRYLHGYRPEEIAMAIHRTDRSVFYYLNRAERHVLEMT